MSKVAIVKGNYRKSNIEKVLELMKDDIEEGIKKKNSDTLFIKINAIDTNYPLACTHPDTLETVLDFFYDRFEKIIVGDNSFVFTKNPNSTIYNHLKEKFGNIVFSDLREFGSKEIVFKTLGGNKKARISTFPSEAFTISLSLPKTHDITIFTGCVKNMSGCVIQGRQFLHGIEIYNRVFLKKIVKANRLVHENLANVFENVKPDLCILDGFIGMEGDGPVTGSSVELGIAMGGEDGVAVDSIATRILGFSDVPYLNICQQRGVGIVDDIQILNHGFQNLDEISRKFKPHYLFEYHMMNELNTIMPKIDFKFLMQVAKRSYRIKDKILDKIMTKNVIG